jgi:hypothetical protein
MDSVVYIVNCIDVKSITNAIGNIVSVLSKSPTCGEWILIAITLAYVIFTARICSYNKKTVVASEKQIEEAKNIQRQNVNIQLLQKRHEAFCLLREWSDKTEFLFNECKNNKNNLIIEFRRELLGDWKDDTVLSDNSIQLKECDVLENNLYDQKRKDELKKKQQWLLYRKWCHIVESLKKIHRKIDSAKYLFFLTDTTINKVKCFTDIYLNITKIIADSEQDKSDQTNKLPQMFKELCNANKSLYIEANIFHEMEIQMDELRTSEVVQKTV